MVQRCYPGGKRKAFNITYDDGVEQDVRFVALLNQYSLKGTFNLNSQLMTDGFSWVHPSGMTVRRLSPDAARQLYDGHEIASHTLTHPYMYALSDEELLYQISEDKHRLEALFGREAAGFAVPFDYYDERIARCVEKCGFEYGRISEESHGYSPWERRYDWRAGIFHLSPELDAYVDGFFQTGEELALCQIVGHSYDLDAENLWDKMEEIFRRVAADENVLPMTHVELVRYLDAMDRLVVCEDHIYNPTKAELWLRWDGKAIRLGPGECVYAGLS